MRLTSSVLTDRLLSDLQSTYGRMATTQSQISSGKRVQQPSDDPVAAAALRLRASEMSGLDRSKQGVASATTYLTAAETGLSHVNDALQRARELAVKAANGTLSTTDRARVAQEIDALAETVKDALGATAGDAYVFSGTATTTRPYATATGDAPQGNANSVVRDLGPGVAIALNGPIPVVGGATAALTADAIAGDGTDGRALQALHDLATHLRSGDVAAVGTTDLQALDANITVVTDARTAIGVTQNRVDAARSRIDDLADAAERLRSGLEDTDLAQALTDLTTQQNAYSAALRAGSQIIQPSLMDFLR